jgi:hypothetical protein
MVLGGINPCLSVLYREHHLHWFVEEEKKTKFLCSHYIEDTLTAARRRDLDIVGLMVVGAWRP